MMISVKTYYPARVPCIGVGILTPARFAWSVAILPTDFRGKKNADRADGGCPAGEDDCSIPGGGSADSGERQGLTAAGGMDEPAVDGDWRGTGDRRHRRSPAVATKTQPVCSSKRSSLPSTTKSELQQKKWEKTRMLVEARLEGLKPKEDNCGDLSNFNLARSTNKKSPEEMVKIDEHVISYEPPMENAKGGDDGNGGNVLISALERAQQIQANLPSKFPSFVKHMSKSHVVRGFWLGLPSKLCVDHLPEHDSTVILVAANEHDSTVNSVGKSKEHSTKYLAGKQGLSAGWRGFSIEHKLVEGDALVFQLIKSCKFKVHIVRDGTSKEENAARSLLNLHAEAEPIKTVKMKKQRRPEQPPVAKKARKKHLEEPVVLNHNRNKCFRKSASITEPASDQSGNSTKNLDGIKLNFEDVTGFEDFEIEYNGLILDSHIPGHLRECYYKLCLSKKCFLHQNLDKDHNINLVVGLINETVKIANAMRLARLGTALDDLKKWDKTLKAFGDMGMMVGFLRARIQKLLNVYHESQAAGFEMKRNELKKAKDELSNLRKRISEGERLIEKLDREIDYFEANRGGDDDLEVEFTEIAGAPW
ncbi:B3 domain-containing protein [Striga hermonthica]|uniref:B3 domain-containing protein n=1 Tax=Striga hermonthica TaxID=68872 RepID=A0A9N7RI98_STRHE|nr:B3 domain-containing protein [Striga hermonthica]